MPTELGGKLAPALANRLRISRAEASRRIHEAADLGERRALNGEPLPPVLPATAEAQRNGEHRRRPCRGDPQLLPPAAGFCRHRDPRTKPRRSWPAWPASTAPMSWPSWPTSSPTASPRRRLHRRRPGQRRGLTIGNQDIDGMSPISGYLTPEARATIDAVFAKLAAPGMCNSADDQPCVSGTPRRPPSRATPAAPDSATTTPCSPRPARCWPPVSSVNTTGCPPASS